MSSLDPMVAIALSLT